MNQELKEYIQNWSQKNYYEFKPENKEDFYEVLSEAEVIWIGNYHEDMDNLMSFDTVVKIGTKFIKFTKYQELSEGYLCWVFNYDSVEEVIQYKEWEKVIKYSTPSEYENYIKKVKNK